MLGVPSGPGEEDWMTVTFKLERLDGTPAEPPSIETTVLAWSPGATIHSRRAGRSRSFAAITTTSTRCWSLRI
jgi:hypothetical protein